jgi:glycosyltransferase involved in cell wall biosynthesis
MIVTDVGGLREIVPDGKCGYVVKSDPGDLARAIADCYEDNKLDVFARNVKNEKAKYSWSRMTASLIEVFKITISDDYKK